MSDQTTQDGQAPAAEAEHMTPMQRLAAAYAANDAARRAAAENNDQEDNDR